MKNAAAFKGCYADWKLIKTRGCVQVVLEIPLHEADAAYQALGGMPDPAAERWFGIARLNRSNVAGAPAASAARRADVDSGDPSTSAPRLRKPVTPDKRLAQQAGILCADTLFWKFADVQSEEGAADFVRRKCGVASRSEIKVGTPEGDEWQKLHGEFLLWRDVPELTPEQHQFSDCQSPAPRALEHARGR